MFENPEIDIEGLPAIDTVEWRPMDRKFAKRKMAESGIVLAIVLAGVIAISLVARYAAMKNDATFSTGWLWLLPLLIAVPGFSWPLISVPKMAYALRDRDILYRSGVFWRTTTAIPFNRIQHVEKSSTPLDRKFKLATLQIFTAGGSGGDLKIHGLPAKTAEKLRTFILNKIGSSIEQD